MKHLYFILVLSFSVFYGISFAQNINDNFQNLSGSENTELLSNYENYFSKPRESLYIHTNKSSYLKGENIWFQGYAYNRQSKHLDSLTRNVEIGIYNKDGQMVDKRLYLTINGIFKGQIAIDSTYKDGQYFLKAETSYMKNFKEDYAHLQSFEIIGEEQRINEPENLGYDLQVLPEGGHIVEDCSSVLGVKLTNEKGVGITYEAALLENGNVIRTFKSNTFGHGKVEFTPKQNSKYTVNAKLANGEVIERTVTDVKGQGLALTIKQFTNDTSLISICSNLPSNFNINTAKMSLFIHQEGSYLEIPVKLENRLGNTMLKVDNATLFDGVNTVTLVLNQKPIAERLIFIRKKIANFNGDLLVETVKGSANDSLNLKLRFSNLDQPSILSISVLPKYTMSNFKNQNISSAFLLDPFVNGYIENKAYYFKNPDRKVDYDLDLLLLTQGWSKYKWTSIFNQKVYELYERENGLTHTLALNGKVPKNVEKFLVHNTYFNSNQVFELPENKKIRLENRYPFRGEEIRFSYITSKRDFLSPKVVVTTPLHLKKDSITITPGLENTIPNLRTIKPEFDRRELYGNVLKGEVLDEVDIIAENKKKLAQKRKYGFFVGDVVEIDKKIVRRFPLLSNYIATQGYFVNDTPRAFTIRKMSGRSARGGSNSLSPVVFLDGVRLIDLNFLSRALTSDFEEILIDRSGFARGEQSDGGVIMLTSRKTALFNKDNQDKIFYAHKIEHGFEEPKEFYMAKYAFYQSEAFQEVGTIGWFSGVTLPSNNSAELQVFDTGLDEFTLYIEGITQDGHLISIEKTIEVR